jgi:hypothetical protein
MRTVPVPVLALASVLIGTVVGTSPASAATANCTVISRSLIRIHTQPDSVTPPPTPGGDWLVTVSGRIRVQYEVRCPSPARWGGQPVWLYTTRNHGVTGIGTAPSKTVAAVRAQRDATRTAGYWRKDVICVHGITWKNMFTEGGA